MRVLTALSAGAASAAAMAAIAVAPAPALAATPAADCQPYSGKPCLFPFPDNRLTRSDRSSATKLRVNLPAAAMPSNTKHVRVGTGPYDRDDGFSPGSTIVVHIAGLDNAAALRRTGVAPITNIAQSLAKRQPVVLIDQATGQRQLVWAELDALATRAAATDLLIHPAKLLAEGHTFDRRAARPAHQVREAHRGAALVRTAARRRPAAGGRALAGHALRVDLQGAQARRDRARQQPVRGLELHRGVAPEPHRADAGDPQQRVRPARRHQPRRHRGRRARTGVHGDRHQAARHLRGDRSPRSTGRSRSRATSSPAAPSTQPGFHYGSSKADATPTQIAGQRRHHGVRVHRPQHGDRL